jgi:hypothetical protein
MSAAAHSAGAAGDEDDDGGVVGEGVVDGLADRVLDGSECACRGVRGCFANGFVDALETERRGRPTDGSRPRSVTPANELSARSGAAPESMA